MKVLTMCAPGARTGGRVRSGGRCAWQPAQTRSLSEEPFGRDLSDLRVRRSAGGYSESSLKRHHPLPVPLCWPEMAHGWPTFTYGNRE